MDNTEKYVDTPTLKNPYVTAENGMAYKIPYGIPAENFYEYLKEFTDLAKVKGLTTRQAQTLFQVCSEYVLDSKLV